MIDLRCPKCGTTLGGADTTAGQTLPCPQCGQHLRVLQPPQMGTVAGVLPTQNTSAGANGKQWFYEQGGKSCDSLSWDELKNMAATGALAPEQRVWSEGMADWQPGGVVHNLFPKQTMPREMSDWLQEHGQAAVPTLSPKRTAPSPVAASDGGGSGKAFERMGVLIFGGTMGLAFLLFIGFMVWKGVHKNDQSVRVGVQPTPPADSDDEPAPKSADGPSGPVDQPQVWEKVQINSRGDGLFIRKYLFSASMYKKIKPKLTNTNILRRELGFRQHWHKIQEFHVDPEDEASTLVVRWTRLGLARKGANLLWEASLAEEQGLTPVTSRGDQVVLAGKVETDLDYSAVMTRVVQGPQGSTDMQILSGPKRVGFRMARLPTDQLGGDASPSPNLEAKKHLMACLGQVYAQPKFTRWWVARSTFKNTTGQTLRDYKVRFHLEEYTSKWQEFSCPVVVPGQFVVDAYYPVMDLEKLVKLTGDRKVHLEVEYQYRKADGHEVRQTKTLLTQMHPRNQVMYSNLSSADCLDSLDRYQNVQYVLAAMSTKDDKLIEELAGRVARLVGRASASDTPADALKFMKGLYLFMSAYLSYQTPAGDIFDGSFSQTVMYGRDVLQKKAGTCIDLAILYASVCQAVGLKPLLIVVPGHCYPVIRLSEPLTFNLPESKSISTCYIGVETTMIGDASFEKALLKRTILDPKHLNGEAICIVDVCKEQDQGIRPLPLPVVSLNDIGISDDDERWARLMTESAPGSGRSSGSTRSVTKSAPEGEKPAAALVGTWSAVDRWPNGIPYSVTLILTKNRSYDLLKSWEQRRRLGGFPEPHEQRINGTYKVSADEILFITDTGKKQSFEYRLKGNQLSVWTNDPTVGKIHYDMKRAPD